MADQLICMCGELTTHRCQMCHEPYCGDCATSYVVCDDCETDRDFGDDDDGRYDDGQWD